MAPDPPGTPSQASSRTPLTGTQGPGHDRQGGADCFLSWLDCCIARTAADVPELIRSAEAAAARYADDGQELGLFGDRGLVSEAYGRSGGLTRVLNPSRVDAPDWQGVVLCFPRESRLADDLARIREFVHAGRHVVLFCRPGIHAAAEATGTGPHSVVMCHAGPEGGLLPDQDRGWAVPTSPAAAIVALWAWIGEFVAACTRMDRMPVMYQSYDVPGARDRQDRFRGMKFHVERPVPMVAGHAARTYLAELAADVTRFRAAERQRVRHAAEAALDAKRRGHRLYAFVHNHTLLRDRIGAVRDPGYFTQLNNDWFRASPELEVGRGDLVLCVGYSRIFNGGDFASFADVMRTRGVRLIWSLASYDRDPAHGPAGIRSDELMIDQHWRYGDAVVDCPGYDVRILPTSGVMAETVMWSVVSDMHAQLHGR